MTGLTHLFDRMELITKRFYISLFALQHLCQTPLSTGEIPPRILPAEVRAPIQTMKAATASRLDHVSANFLRAGGHRLHGMLAAYLKFQGKDPRPVQNLRTILRRAIGRIFRNAAQDVC
ncbi:unnamed protein product [Strongylus vulgaris]|uniref:Uncharacterized protein n=1 Tax=Strongylus vulgaris TaxID=40348 RepID=A0A3P7IS65_STRVU|nr:unnamed protein product [Strongylus vulgaris]